MIRLPPLEEVARRWFEIEPILARATRHSRGCEEPIDLLAQVFANQGAIWLVEDRGLIGVIVTRIDQRPRKRLFVIGHVAGKRLAEWWPEALDIFERICRERGCSAIGCYGRPGWVRYWKSRGVAMHVASEIMVREVGNA